MKSLGIIPARFASTRFPGKPLVEISGKTMIQRTYEQCLKTKKLVEVIVATDDQRIFDHVQSFGGKVMMTRTDHPSGTDRIAEIAKKLEGFDIVVNIQGDEPFIRPEQIEAVLKIFEKNPTAEIATGIRPIENEEDVFNQNIVKVVLDKNGKTLYFSRSPIPYIRGKDKKEWSAEYFFKHIGMYAFRVNVLLAITQLPPSSLEQLESLEQLRWLENGYSIFATQLPFDSVGIDTPEDLEKINFKIMD